MHARTVQGKVASIVPRLKVAHGRHGSAGIEDNSREPIETDTPEHEEDGLGIAGMAWALADAAFRATVHTKALKNFVH